MDTIKVGTKVIKNSRYHVPLEKQGVIYTVSSEPWNLCGTAVVKLSGEAAGYALDGLTPVMKIPPVEWVSVKDRLPVENKTVLLRFHNNAACGFYDYVYGVWCVWTANGFYTDVLQDEAQPTHWMEMPQGWAEMPPEA